jgi:hypothetical protein
VIPAVPGNDADAGSAYSRHIDDMISAVERVGIVTYVGI